jgi:hypothetical protein
MLVTATPPVSSYQPTFGGLEHLPTVPVFPQTTQQPLQQQQQQQQQYSQQQYLI